MNTILLVVFINIYSVESRVFCQDSHASSWMPLGFSCPLNCGNIVTAVKRLKTIDYRQMFMNRSRKFENSSTERINTNSILNRPARRNFNFIPNNSFKINKILEDKKLITSLKIALKLAVNGSDLKCPLELNGGKTNMSNCRRTYDHDEFVKKFTILLNKYTQSKYQFTEEMTSMILEKILGTNMDLRHGIFNVKRILAYLSKALRYHRTHIKQDLVIKLKSRHCLSLSVAGCYCNIGLVESSGQCVQPSDCIGKQDAEYLARIILL